ncbi:MAG: hypothetical protein A2Z34_03845 [Planctomycetes bacterium RBG_16_59_8]|nr:MAG: hypothetical protein A2Z34_03845 [Planctomycetes bacterium RBG_16_59_8]
MECREIQEKISANMDGELAEGERGTVTRHLQECPVCRRLEEELRGIAAEIAALPRRKAPPSIAQAVAREINASAETKVTPFPRRRTIEWVVAAAALLLVAVNVVFVWRAHETEEGKPKLEKRRATHSKSPADDTLRRTDKSGAPERAREPAEKLSESTDDARKTNDAVAAKPPAEQPKAEKSLPPEKMTKGGRFNGEAAKNRDEEPSVAAPESKQAKAEDTDRGGHPAQRGYREAEKFAQQAEMLEEKPKAPAKADVETIVITAADPGRTSSLLIATAKEMGLPHPDPVGSDKSDGAFAMRDGEKSQKDGRSAGTEEVFLVTCTEDQLARLLEGVKREKSAAPALAAAGKMKEAEESKKEEKPLAADSGANFKKAMPSAEGAAAPGAAVERQLELDSKSFGGGAGGRAPGRLYLIRIVREPPPADQR